MQMLIATVAIGAATIWIPAYAAQAEVASAYATHTKLLWLNTVRFTTPKLGDLARKRSKWLVETQNFVPSGFSERTQPTQGDLGFEIYGDTNSKEAHADIHNDISDGTTEKEEEKVQVKIMLYRQFLQVSDELCKVKSTIDYKNPKRKISHNFTHTCRTCIILT